MSNRWLGADTSYFCTDCHAFSETATPVETSHSSTGETGCRECHSADGLRYVVGEIGDDRTIAGGYVPASKRNHDGCVTVERATRIAVSGDD